MPKFIYTTNYVVIIQIYMLVDSTRCNEKVSINVGMRGYSSLQIINNITLSCKK